MMHLHILGLIYLSSNWNLTQASHIPFRVTRLVARRFGKENLNLPQIEGCPGEICGNLFGRSAGVLLAGADPCAAQDLADEIITSAKTNPKIKSGAREKMIEAAIKVAGAEHNVPPDFQKNGLARKALHCLKEPKNDELQGIVIKQDPAATGDEFFDPKTKKTVKLGEDPRTVPRGGGNGKGNENKDKSKGGQDGKDDQKSQDRFDETDKNEKNESQSTTSSSDPQEESKVRLQVDKDQDRKPDDEETEKEDNKEDKQSEKKKNKQGKKPKQKSQQKGENDKQDEARKSKD